MAQISDPIPGDVAFGDLTIELTEFSRLPQSSGGGTGWARINHLKPDGTGRLFVNDLRGRMYIVSEGEADLYLDLKSEIGSNFKDASGLGAGFTSFAFHPDFASNGIFYTAHAEKPGSGTADFAMSNSNVEVQGVVMEWTASNPSASTWSGTSRELMRVNITSSVHGMQEISFNTSASPSSDDYGMLYICIGDGGSGNRGLSEYAHRLDSVLGTILRIDPFGNNSENGKYGIPSDNAWASDGDDNTFGEIYAYGFRNPHRISWDPNDETKMFAGGIGEKNIEEVNLIESGNDYGWNVREGTFVINGDWENNPKAGDNDEVFALPANDASLGYTYPVAQYDHDEGVAVIGGYVYRGSSLPALRGRYLFGDLGNGGRLYFIEADSVVQNVQSEIRRVRVNFDGSTYDKLSDMTSSGSGSRDPDMRFGYDGSGELYILSKHNGKVYKISGAEDPSVVVEDVPAGAPAAPTGLSADAGDGVVTLEWNANSEADFQSYSVYRSESSGSGYALLRSSVSTSRFVDDSANNDVTYYYVVRAEDLSGNVSDDSSEKSATPFSLDNPVGAPAAPIGVSIESGDDAVSLSWSANSEADFAGYRVLRSIVSGFAYAPIQTGVTDTNYVDNTAVNGGVYYYVVQAEDAVGNVSDYSAQVVGTPSGLDNPVGAPDSPIGLVSMAEEGGISLSWTANSESDLASYQVYRSALSGTGFNLLANGLTTTTYRDDTAEVGVTYYYVIEAVDLSGHVSDRSDEVSSSAFVVANPQPAKLINISTRGSVGEGTAVMIGGFFIEGTENMKVLIQGVGQELIGEGGLTESDVLSDPTILLVYPNGDQVGNDNWNSEDELAKAQAMLDAGSFVLDSSGRSSAILRDLAPGLYTVILSGVNGSEGVALIEVYAVPSE